MFFIIPVCQYLGQTQQSGWELPFLDEDLENFQLIWIEPDFVAGHAFVHGDDIMQTVRPGDHTGAAARTGDP
jgi:hypothetical protein